MDVKVTYVEPTEKPVPDEHGLLTLNFHFNPAELRRPGFRPLYLARTIERSVRAAVKAQGCALVSFKVKPGVVITKCQPLEK